MQIRCYSCGTPFNLKKEAVHAALDMVTEEDLNHFNAHCPRCRKANRIATERLQRAAPDWVPAGERSQADQAEKEE